MELIDSAGHFLIAGRPLAKADRWITIHPSGRGVNARGENADYRRIKLDGNGNIVGGSVPKDLQGQNIREAFRKNKKPQPYMSRHLTEQGVEHHMTEKDGARSYQIGAGVQNSTDKWGRATAKRGTVQFQNPQPKPNLGDGTYVHVYSNFDDKETLKSMGARFDGYTKSWYIPLKDVPNVAHKFKDATITNTVANAYEEELSKAPETPAKKDVVLQTKNGEVKFEAKHEPAWDGKMPPGMEHVNLYSHQKAGVEFLLENKKAILGMAVGLGKCVAGNTPIQLEDGSVVPIADVVNRYNFDFGENNEAEHPISGLKVPALDVGTGNIDWCNVLSVFKQKINNDLYEVQTQRGRIVRLTGDHPLPVVRDGSLAWVRTRDILQGDTIAIPQIISGMPALAGLTPSEARLLAWQIAEGHEDGVRNAAEITNKDVSVLEWARDYLRSIAIKATIDYPKNRCSRLRMNGRIYREWLESHGIKYGTLSANKTIPQSVFHSSDDAVREFLRAIFEAEACVSQYIQIEFVSASYELITGLSYLLLRFGIVGQIRSCQKAATNGKNIKRTYWRMYISSRDMRTFRDRIGFVSERKQSKLEVACQKSINENLNVVPFYKQISSLANEFNVPLKFVVGRSAAFSVSKEQSFSPLSMAAAMNSLEQIYNGTLEQEQRQYMNYLDNTSHRSGFGRTKRRTENIARMTGNKIVKGVFDKARILSNPQLAWDKIASIQPVLGEHVVYDLRVDKNHSFVGGHGGGMFLHNTPSAITAANVLLQQGKVNRFAVIAPSSVKYQWKSEVEKFSDKKAVVLDSSMSAKKLAQAFEDAKDADFVIANYEMLRNADHAAKLKELSGNAVIADEGHKVKNYKSQQTKAFKDTFKDAKYKWLLTATPFPNAQPMETYTMLGHATAKVGTWRDWSGKYAVLESVRTPNGTIQKPVALKNQNKLKEEMKDTVFLRTHTSPDVNSSLPSARHVTHSMEMTKEQSKLYSAMQDDVMHELEGMNDDDYKKNAINVLAKMKHLEQIATDPDQLNPEKVDMKKLYPKEQWAVDTIADHLEDKENRGIVVFSDSKLPLEKVKAGLISEGLSSSQIGIISGDVSPEKRKAVQDAFSDGKIKVVLATSAGEEGINLQAGGHTMIHMDTPWVPKSITQREGRILRTGQPSKHTLFYSPVMSGTVEDQKRGKLGAKVAEIEKLLGEGAAGSAAENVSAAAKAWTLADMKEMLGVGKLGTTKKIKKSFVQRGRLLIKKRRRAG